jgi:putative MATE family efflux protein
VSNEDKFDLTTGRPGARLRNQAIPFGFALLAIFSFEAIDLFFIARLGDAPLAAASFTFPVIWLIYAIGIGFESGVASCVSRAVGQNNHELARRLTTDSAILATAVVLVISLIGLATIQPVFRLLGATDTVLPLIQEYMTVWYWVGPTDVALWTCLASIRARGRAQLESKIIIGAAMLNLVLDPIMIFGLFGFPRLEMQGAALATLTANFVMLVFSLFYLNLKLQVFARIFAPIRVIVDSWKHMLTIGIPAMASHTIIPISNGIVVAMIATMGVEAVAGFGVAMRLEPIALLPFFAISAVTSPFFGQNIGANAFDRLTEARRLIAKFCILFGLALAGTLAITAYPLTGLFSESPEIRQVATDYIWIASLGFGAHGIVMSTNSAFNGMGKPIPGLVISSCRVIFVFMPLAWLGLWIFGLRGIFAATAVANILVGTVAYLWLGRRVTAMSRRHSRSLLPSA